MLATALGEKKRGGKMKTLVVLLATAVIVGVMPNAFAGDRELVSENETFRLFLDRDRLVRNSETGKAWFYFEYKYVQEGLNARSDIVKFRSRKDLVHFNCSEKTFAFSQTILYSEAGGVGDVVDRISASAANLEFTDPVPNSIGDTMLLTACFPIDPAVFEAWFGK